MMVRTHALGQSLVDTISYWETHGVTPDMVFESLENIELEPGLGIWLMPRLLNWAEHYG